MYVNAKKKRTTIVWVNKQFGVNAANICFWFWLCSLAVNKREYAYPHIDLSEVNEQCKQIALIYDKTINVIGKRSLEIAHIFCAYKYRLVMMTHFILVLSSTKRLDDYYYLFIFHTPSCGRSVAHSLAISPLLWLIFFFVFLFCCYFHFFSLGLRDSWTTIWM